MKTDVRRLGIATDATGESLRELIGRMPIEKLFIFKCVL